MFQGTLDIVARMDRALAEQGFRLVTGTMLPRTYEGGVAGCRTLGSLSVMVPSQHMPAGYVLSLEVHTPLRARFACGEIPVMLRGGMQPVAGAPGDLRAHDPLWARRFVERPPAREALRELCAGAKFIEHRPNGVLHLQVQSFGAVVPPDFACLLPALAFVVATALEGPPPTPPRPRWTDNRSLVMVAVAVAVLLLLAAVAVPVWWFAR